MSTIIAARFEDQDHGEKVVAALRDAGFSPEGISLFYVNPHGQHDIYPIGGDENTSPGARESGKGALAGGGVGAVVGAAAGLAATPVAGPLGVAIGAGIGAYTGSLAGAMGKTDQGSGVDEAESRGELDEEEVKQHKAIERQAGTYVAVRTGGTESRAKQAVELFRVHGGVDIEHAEGELRNGHWTTFDPRSVVNLV
ncbi:hypothetical protein HG264_15935 [Pseudomonas sp. gcc21]|uniref:hypothetical protein n=1 Tax=Pseudomonas sp. gcc21 TaxID=2726989 RepID=UPI00145154E4|nr:hypothetical protein [Pseudomonas sp. gcc21]QJD60263.1 hypothetical protein HG264_15935 [Pseudomonas sp. gcc21]